MTEPALRSRTARLVLCDRNENLLGSPGTVQAEEPWLQQTAAVVRATKEKWGIDVTILRLLDSSEDSDTVYVTYLAEIDPAAGNLPELKPWQGTLTDDPHRLPYARPGGPQADLDWALAALAEQDISLVDTPEQIRTWNLSSIWRLPTSAGDFWLKAVPPFFGHEGAIIELLKGERVPTLLASSAGRILMQNIPGHDCYNAALGQILAMVTELVDLQSRWQPRTNELFAIGVPDARSNKLVKAITEVVGRNLAAMNNHHRQLLEAFVADLPDRFARLDACNVPDTLVHGDYHPGNWRANGEQMFILDWGDCYIGNPLLDRPALLDRVNPNHLAIVDKHWRDAFKQQLPDADIDAACELIEPVATAKMAVTFQMFLDNIEESEKVYHANDVPLWLKKVAEQTETELGSE